MEIFFAVGLGICAFLHCLIIHHLLKKITDFETKLNLLEKKWAENYECIVKLQETTEFQKQEIERLDFRIDNLWDQIPD